MDPDKFKYALFYVFFCASLYLIFLTENSTDFFAEKLDFYEEDLPPAENVLLATGYRTGSSFFAEIFNQNDEVFYVNDQKLHMKLIKFSYSNPSIIC